ncbi:Serine/threonine protein kinase [Tindallia magadiensis]|uniref:Serine/threonine protein kinase n=2 Tax=Tindallia magadiensis TaxID=69895 RepID=A0A1I3ERK8_9FIRM|nr:Serine/threonine protein kinase [Tindallia magadiensis]
MSMSAADVCLGCMAKKTEEDTCPVCGWIHGTGNESHMHLQPGTMLNDKYLIGKALGQGGFGVTYLGWDINLKLKLAVKEYMPQDLASRALGDSQVSVYTMGLSDQYEYGLEKFLLEAQTLAQFEGHPNIVSVRDFFRANGTAYIVMSYIEGITLKEYVQSNDNRLAVDKTIGIVMPVLDALKEVHQVGILHRDISPDNVFITSKGQVILIDFGAARQAIGEKGRSLSIVLKPGYTPEEQYRSKGVQGPWTDIYAVGAMIYRVLCAQMPPESLDRLEEDTLAPPSHLGVEITPAQERAILKAMAVRASDRFQSVEEFQQALLSDTPVSYEPEKPVKTSGASAPMPPPPGEVSSGKAKASPVKPVYLAVAGAAAVLLIVVGFAMSRGGDDSGAAVVHEPEATVETGEALADNLDPDLAEEEQTPEVIPEQLSEGSFEYQNGIYTGEHYNDLPEGFGIWEGPDGEVYEGEWHNGLPHGQGVLNGADGDIYDGEWANGNREGYGVYVSANNVRYAGEWINNRRNGRGTEVWPNGAEYTGEYKDDMRHGQGIYTWANGDSYNGEWRDGFQHGHGALTYANGQVREGQWVNNEFQE